MNPAVLSVIVPCFNEGPNLPELTERLRALYACLNLAAETILVDDASTDDTYAVICRLTANQPEVRSLRHESNLGLFRAWQTGLTEASGSYVAMIDADLQYQPEDIGRLWEHLDRTHCDIVQGARFNVTGERGLRYWLSRGLNGLLNLAFQMSLHDNKSGFFLTRREFALDMLKIDPSFFYPQTFIMVAAATKGYSIGEVRCVFAKRELGESFLPRYPIVAVAKSVIDVVRGLRVFRGRSRQIGHLRTRLDGQPPPRLPGPRPAASSRALQFQIRSMPLHHWMITREAGRRFEELECSQWMTRRQMAELQREKLHSLVRHAYDHVPFYRKRLERAGIAPNRVDSIEDLATLEPLTKDDIRSYVHSGLLAENARLHELCPVKTSGSTGEPLSCYVDRFQLEMRWASTLRSQEWTGYRFGDPTVRLWHQSIGLKPSQIAKERLDAWLSRRLFIPAFNMTSQNLDDTVRKILEHRPAMIDGYAESLNLLARYLASHPRQCPSLKGLVSSAQTLSRASREVIERSFGCAVFDKYGAREFSGIAYQCDHHHGYHVMAESYIVEILRNGRPALPGEIGEVFVTDLNNYCMPFLRYKIGDLAKPLGETSCACGRGLPLIGEIMGRTQAIIVGANNRFLPGTFFAHLIKEYDSAIRQFQVVQDTPGALQLRVVKAPRFSQSSIDDLLNELHRYLGCDTRVEVVYVDEIEMVRTGKVRHSISKVEFDFQQLSARPNEAALMRE